MQSKAILLTPDMLAASVREFQAKQAQRRRVLQAKKLTK